VSGGDDALSFVYLMGCLVLVGSAFFVRRIPIAQGAKMALAWVLIFAVIFVGFTLRDDFAALAKRVVGETTGGGMTVADSGEVRIRKAEDGHFWARAKINGEDVDFLVDSGATVTTVSADTASRTGLEPFGATIPAMTANGMAAARRSRAERMVVGGIERGDFPIHVAGERGETNLLGMNFLSTLSRWQVEGEYLVLVP
jgi:aspartyl protease family protein